MASFFITPVLSLQTAANPDNIGISQHFMQRGSYHLTPQFGKQDETDKGKLFTSGAAVRVNSTLLSKYYTATSDVVSR